MAKAGTIDTNGRSVRCARCQNVWFVDGSEPDTRSDALALEDNQTVLIEAAPDPQPELPLVAPSMTPNIGAHTRLRDKVDADKLTKRRRVLRFIWAVPLIGLLGAASFAYLKRQSLVDQFPAAATLYQAIGLNVKANGLDVGNLATETLIVDGETVLRVTGQVENLLPTAQTVPLLQMRLENRSGEPVADWFVDVGQVEGKGTKQIETDYPNPPLDGFELRYRFVAD
jgi:hypothetical protein